MHHKVNVYLYINIEINIMKQNSHYFLFYFITLMSIDKRSDTTFSISNKRRSARGSSESERCCMQGLTWLASRSLFNTI
jgi:hypothetical protein